MRNSDSDNATNQHNETITARPRIFFPSKSGEWVLHGHLVAEFTAAHATPGSPEYKELEKGTTEFDRNRLRGLRLLRYVDVKNDETAVRKALNDAGQLLHNLPESMAAGLEVPKRLAGILYCGYLTSGMKAARLGIIRNNHGEFIPVVGCPDIKTALFVFAAYRGVEACMNCQKLFAVDSARPDGSSSDRYCTAACGQRYRQKLYRLRQKVRIKKLSKRKAKR